MQAFKGDAQELKFIASAEPIHDVIDSQKDLFLAECFEAEDLGDLLYTTLRAPLANAINEDVFKSTFKQIFESFESAGSFESYIAVFQKIFGLTVEIVFTVPGPGQLNIDITAEGLEQSNFIARHVEGLEYAYDDVVDADGFNIIFETVKGFQTQYELEQMLFEMVPAGIYTEITLSL